VVLSYKVGSIKEISNIRKENNDSQSFMDVYYYVISSFIVGKYGKIGRSNVFILNQVPSGGSQLGSTQ
jgi:hypothetical protein